MVTFAWIAAERADVALDPFQRLDLIEQAVIAGNAIRRFCAQAPDAP